MTTMLADIVEGADLIIAAADHDDRGARVLGQDECTGLRELASMCRQDPRAAEYVLPLEFEECLLHVAASGNPGEFREVGGNLLSLGLGRHLPLQPLDECCIHQSSSHPVPQC